jgi:hypothetical protein
MKLELVMSLEEAKVKLIPENLGERRILDLLMFREKTDIGYAEHSWPILADAVLIGRSNNKEVKSITITFPMDKEPSRD